MSFARRLFPHLDWPLVFAIFGIMLLGLLSVYSLTYDQVNHRAGHEFWVQLAAVAASLAVFVLALAIDYRALTQRSLFIYAGFILILVYVTFFGEVHKGARRWIPLHFFNLQPSEFARLALALVLAMFYGESRGARRSSAEIAIGAAFVVVPFLLIKHQPDLGTALTLIPVYLGVAFLAGIR